MKNYVFTGISGSGRIELLNELKTELVKRGKSVNVFDVGKIIFDSAGRLDIKISDEKVLDIDKDLLTALRKIALDEVRLQITEQPADFNLIGIHATFRWKNRLIKGVSFRELNVFKIEGFINVVDNVSEICKINSQNPKWRDTEKRNIEETNNWIMEEEFITEVLAEFHHIPVYIISRKHNICNLADLFLTDKKRMYSSYPITQIRKDKPELLDKIREDILPKLENEFIVFDPLLIRDMDLIYQGKIDLPDSIEKVSEKAASQLKAKTVERDFQFIDQSDFIVVLYFTDKVSVGVLSEIIYAHRHNKPAFMVFPFPISPFLQYATTMVFKTEEELFKYFHSPEFDERFKNYYA
jgi:adenylate kinase